MILFDVEHFWSVSWKAVRLEKHFDCKVFFADFNWKKKIICISPAYWSFDEPIDLISSDHL